MDNGIIFLILMLIMYFFSSEMFKLNERYEVDRKILKCDFNTIFSIRR